eukprot:CAMPEP_0175821878 /NCGR_PEP_ID=MMETSP0107_2-20121207/9380_1 /TAXON_ID=195067 ORGANISM="Goniomonas pacifica, Strain CCMP1869" /NCGR_SAMPLE_ID=MMETSP0107_2 /ASSEMBLY_ACC=CAM_ASM_000203 /LENGTH=428 /DNA_ID=CAMNT_0017134307 /DNA_START=171 /DNA_END=1457 /DNA_ORIENTATION=+
MSSKWEDCASQIVSFERGVPNRAEGSAIFVRSQMHLFSLLHALALQYLRQQEDLSNLVNMEVDFEVSHEGHSEELGVIGGLSRDELEILQKVDDRTFLVYTWIQRDVTYRHLTGGLAVPAPILSRVYQTISDGMTANSQAQKISKTPFPFPYAQLVTVLVLFFTISAPLIISTLVDNILLICLFSFLTTMGSSALDEVAKEIEDPFGFDPNDLPLSIFQQEYNSRLRTLLGDHKVIQFAGAQLPRMASELELGHNLPKQLPKGRPDDPAMPMFGKERVDQSITGVNVTAGLSNGVNERASPTVEESLDVFPDPAATTTAAPKLALPPPSLLPPPNGVQPVGATSNASSDGPYWTSAKYAVNEQPPQNKPPWLAAAMSTNTSNIEGSAAPVITPRWEYNTPKATVDGNIVGEPISTVRPSLQQRAHQQS